jgi:hypothetical protein
VSEHMLGSMSRVTNTFRGSFQRHQNDTDMVPASPINRVHVMVLVNPQQLRNIQSTIGGSISFRDAHIIARNPWRVPWAPLSRAAATCRRSSSQGCLPIRHNRSPARQDECYWTAMPSSPEHATAGTEVKNAKQRFRTQRVKAVIV